MEIFESVSQSQCVMLNWSVHSSVAHKTFWFSLLSFDLSLNVHNVCYVILILRVPFSFFSNPYKPFLKSLVVVFFRSSLRS